ncbi:hypothetical protein [Alteromonas gracilis]|uniref:hypothetical protein n=1 Tax=Alteromonas gracilis TaxID=1479524 RepID=UPI0037359B8D
MHQHSVNRTILATLLPILLVTNAQASNDDCTSSLDLALTRWRETLNTYQYKPLRRHLEKQAEIWAAQRSERSDTKILKNALPLMGLLNANELGCFSKPLLLPIKRPEVQ